MFFCAFTQQIPYVFALKRHVFCVIDAFFLRDLLQSVFVWWVSNIN